MHAWNMIKRILKSLIIFILFILGLVLVFALVGIFDCASSSATLASSVSVVTPALVKESQQKINGYNRPLTSTYLIFPEWYIVYSSTEYAHFLKNHRPSGFPYFGSIEQYWCGYHTVYELTKAYPFNWGDNLMLTVIGVSLSTEYVMKGLYENSIGRFTEWTSSDQPTEEDIYAQKVAQEYAEFIPLRPWFEFPFSKSLSGLWHDTSLTGPHMIRKWERKFILSMEYSIKAGYGWLIGLGSHAALGAASDYVYATIEAPSAQAFSIPGVKLINHVTGNVYIIAIPHEQPFTDAVKLLSTSNMSFVDIAGNHSILITIITPINWQDDLKSGKVLFTMKVLTDPNIQRVAIQVPVNTLLADVNLLSKEGILLEHVYDY